MNNKYLLALIALCVGFAVGALSMFSANKAELQDQDKTITRLEADVKHRPVVTVEDLGVCRVEGGGRKYLLVDISDEIEGGTVVDPVEDNPYRATEMEVEAVK